MVPAKFMAMSITSIRKEIGYQIERIQEWGSVAGEIAGLGMMMQGLRHAPELHSVITRRYEHIQARSAAIRERGLARRQARALTNAQARRAL